MAVITYGYVTYDIRPLRKPSYRRIWSLIMHHLDDPKAIGNPINAISRPLRYRQYMPMATHWLLLKGPGR